MTERACLPEPPCDCLTVDVLAGLLLPVLGERGVEVLVQLARRVVRDVEQRLRVQRRRGERRRDHQQPGAKPCPVGSCHVHCSRSFRRCRSYGISRAAVSEADCDVGKNGLLSRDRSVGGRCPETNTARSPARPGRDVDSRDDGGGRLRAVSSCRSCRRCRRRRSAPSAPSSTRRSPRSSPSRSSGNPSRTWQRSQGRAAGSSASR